MFEKEILENIRKSRLKGNIKIYFAHTLDSRDHVENVVIPRFKETGFLIVNPFEDRLEVLSGYKRNQSVQENLKITPTWIIQHDLVLLNDCDAIIVYSPEKATYGTNFEMNYSFFIKKIPIFMIVNKNDLNHPHLTLMCSVLVEEKDMTYLIERIAMLFNSYK